MNDEGRLSEETFKTKWQDTFDVSYAGIGNGFLISAQDWVDIRVSNCTLVSNTSRTYFFEVVIAETTSQEKYRRDIKVVKSGESFLIADVLEYPE